MANGVWQRFIRDSSGRICAGASLTVIDADSGDLVALTSDATIDTTIANPVFSDASGMAKFYAPPGRVNIQIAAAGKTSLLTDVIIFGETDTSDNMFDRTDNKTITVSSADFGFNIFYGYDPSIPIGDIAPNQWLFEDDPQVGAANMYLSALYWDSLNSKLHVVTSNFDWTMTKELTQDSLVSLSIARNGGDPVVITGAQAEAFNSADWAFGISAYDGSDWRDDDTLAVIITLHC